MSEPIERLLSCLGGVTQTGVNCWMARCPAHDDRTPSLSIREVDDGRLLVYCFAGCDTGTVLDAAGLTMADLFPGGPRGHRIAPLRRRISPSDALLALTHEARVVQLAAEALANGDQLTDELRQRCALAVHRIGVARDAACG